MKKLCSLVLCVMALLFAACEPNAPATSSKVETGAASDITTESVVLHGVVNLDISQYEDVEFGMMVSEDKAELNARDGEMYKAKVLIGKDFELTLEGLSPETKYYYCAWVFLNNTQYEFGVIKEFVTIKENAGNTDNPNSNYTAKAFSVSSSKQVYFSPGNLQYHPADNQWRFAPSQLDYIGEANKYVSISYNGWLDLFGWSTSATKFGVSASMDWENAFLGDFVDWGKNKIGNDAPNTWRTLTYEEWGHILAYRPKASSLYGLAQVNGVKGLVLLPDNWTCPSGVSLKLNINSFFEMTTDQWSQLEAAGAIWLPLAGNRWGTDLYDVQNIGVYWTSTEWSINQAIYVQFTIDETVLCYFSGRADGRSIRLVKDL